MAALDLIAEHEGNPAGAVIGPGAVVADAAPELREHQQDHVVGVIVRPEVCIKASIPSVTASTEGGCMAFCPA